MIRREGLMGEHYEFMKVQRECPHLFLDEKGIPNCKYHDSSIGVCKPEFCPERCGT